METFYLNEIIVRTLNHWAISSLYASNFVVFCGVYLGWLILLFLVVYIFQARRRWYTFKFILIAIVTALIALFISDLIKSFYPVERPSAVLPGVISVFTPADVESFPSSHMAFYGALAFAIFWRKRRFGQWLLVGVTLIGLARIAGGIHYPLDIIVGILLGYLVSRFLKHWLKVR